MASLSIIYGDRIKSRGNTNESLDRISNCLNEIISLKLRILPELAIDVTKDIGAQLEQELADMTKAIQDAADRIEDMMLKTKQKDSGVKLEVNGKVLDACTTLMQAIIQLIKDAKHLQEEIKAKTKVISFYDYLTQPLMLTLLDF